MKTLYCVTDGKEKRGKLYYTLFEEGKNYDGIAYLQPIGFDGLQTDYDEIRQFKKKAKDFTFTYFSERYTTGGLPRDIVYCLKDKFDHVQVLNASQSGIYHTQVKTALKMRNDEYYIEE